MDNWERAAGPPCPRCGGEMLRSFQAKAGRVCRACSMKEEGQREKLRLLNVKSLSRGARRKLREWLG